MPPMTDVPVLPVALAVALVGASAIRAWRRAGGARPRARSGDSRVATSVALDEIDALVDATGDDADLVAAYDRLSQLVVRYIARTYGMTNRARTSAEIVRAVRARHGGVGAGEVAALLDPCDAAKFARGARDLAAFRRHAAAVREFVRRREGS
jgi:hypothetical protein